MTQPFANWFWFWQVFLPTLIPECGAISMNKMKRKKSQFDQKQRKNERLKIGYNNTTRAQKEEAKKQGKSVKFVQEKCKRCFCWAKLTRFFFQMSILFFNVAEHGIYSCSVCECVFVWMESLTTSLEPCVYAVSYIFQIYLSFPWIEREKEMIHSTDLRPFNEPIHGNKLLMHSRYDFACVCAGFFFRGNFFLG